MLQQSGSAGPGAPAESSEKQRQQRGTAVRGPSCQPDDAALMRSSSALSSLSPRLHIVALIPAGPRPHRTHPSRCSR